VIFGVKVGVIGVRACGILAVTIANLKCFHLLIKKDLVRKMRKILALQWKVGDNISVMDDS
jgi:hypothetical protein